MTKEDAIRFAKAFGLLAEAFGEGISSTRTKVYFRALGDLDIAQVERAIDMVVRDCKFFPKPAELREMIEGSQDDRAQQAWIALKKIAPRFANWPSLYCEDPATAQAILATFGSWLACAEFLNTCSAEMEASKQKEFLRNYRTESRRPSEHQSRYLPGQFEIANRENLPFWKNKWRANGLSDYRLQVVRLAANCEYKAFMMPCPIESGQLSRESRLQLETGEGIIEVSLPAGKPPLQLPSSNMPKQLAGEVANDREMTGQNEVPSSEEVRAAIRSASQAIRSTPGLSEEQFEERVKVLKCQAAAIEKELTAPVEEETNTYQARGTARAEDE